MTPKVNASGERGVAAHAAASNAAAAIQRLVILDRLELVKRLQRLFGRERVGIDRVERHAQRRRRLRLGRLARSEEIARMRARPQLPLELREVTARGAHDILRNAGEVRDMDAVRAIRRAALDAMQEDDAVAMLDGVDVHVGDVGKLRGELRELEVM